MLSKWDSLNFIPPAERNNIISLINLTFNKHLVQLIVVLPFSLDVVVPRPPVSNHVRLLIKRDDNIRKFPPNFTPFKFLNIIQRK